MKIFITGGSGLLGQYLNIILSKEFNILSVYNKNYGNCLSYNSREININNLSNLENVIKEFLPDIVIHTAGYTRPEVSDSLPYEEVYRTNTAVTKFIAEICDLINAKLIFTSTDLVYDGNQGEYLGENAKLDPLSSYADTKLKAEEEIKKVFENYVILRTSLLYGMGLNHSVNNFSVMLNNFRDGKPSRLFYDQYRTPLSLLNAAEMIKEIIQTNIKSETIHFSGMTRVSRAELGEILCDIGKFDKNLIERISLDDMPEIQKVYDVSLNTDKLKYLGLKQKSIEESIIEILNQKI
ncbi:MAG: NAD(P)-dependent oxidoreductase [Ignavibacteria bacterium]|nr:NAD(P)-dependent oxidoreductase [Ignavibacteria bacterium]